MSETLSSLDFDLHKELDSYEHGLIEELFPGAKVAAFELSIGPRWEKAHTERGAEVAGFLQRLNEVHGAETLDIDSYMALLDEADSKIDSLVTPEFVDDPVSIQVDPEYAYIWNNTHKNVARSLTKRAESLSNDEKNDLNAHLLDYMKSRFGRYPRDIEFDRQRDIFWLIESTWTGETANQIRKFYNEAVTEHTGVSDYSTWSLEYSNIKTYGAHLQDFIIHSCTEVIDRDGTTDEEREGITRLVNSMMDDHVFGNLKSYVEIYQKLGTQYSVEPLLQNLRSENVTRRRVSAEILYRLELGKIGVSEDGAKYLGKIYDLGKYNDPDFFVRRLNNSGLMAVLAQEGNIEGVFPLDLNSEEDLIHAEVRQLISQELFLPKADETQREGQEREDYLKLFLQNYENIFNDDFFQNTGVRLNSLDLHEQGWFLLHYLELSKNDNQESLEKLNNFVKEYGEYGLKSFLALEYGGSGEDIIAFSEDESISKEQKLSLFKNFYCIANEAMNWKKIFEKVENGLEYKFSTEAYESLIRKNAEFFKAAQIISRSSDNEKLMIELFSSMNSVARSLVSLESLYNGGSSLKLVGKPSIHDEYGENGELIKGARYSWVFDSVTGDRIAVSIRSKNTIEKDGIKGGGPRINFKVTNPKTNVSTRIGFDLSYYHVLMGESDTPSVSLDLGILDPRFEAVNYSTESVGRILSLVQDSEGGHNESSFNPEASKHFENIANSFVEYINRTF